MKLEKEVPYKNQESETRHKIEETRNIYITQLDKSSTLTTQELELFAKEWCNANFGNHVFVFASAYLL